jgi:hypothetical protein
MIRHNVGCRVCKETLKIKKAYKDFCEYANMLKFL